MEVIPLEAENDCRLLDYQYLPDRETLERIYRVAKAELQKDESLEWLLVSAYMLGFIDGKRAERARRRPSRVEITTETSAHALTRPLRSLKGQESIVI
jgi:hypothetical protein